MKMHGEGIRFYLLLSAQAGPSPYGHHGNPGLGGDKLQHGGQGGAGRRRRPLFLEHQTLKVRKRLHVGVDENHVTSIKAFGFFLFSRKLLPGIHQGEE